MLPSFYGKTIRFFRKEFRNNFEKKLRQTCFDEYFLFVCIKFLFLVIPLSIPCTKYYYAKMKCNYVTKRKRRG